ncbi:MAG: hypothetical protein J0I19_07555 [Alphaproteobacteria bacterium]|nr:hypothetical protein [Alphaproteobacteria bacterium]
MLAKFRGHHAISTVICLSILAGAAVSAHAQIADPYVSCSFYPQGTGCQEVLQQALRDSSPAAASVRSAFEQYARYLSPENAGLSADDKVYLVQNGIRFFDLEKGNLEGLHNVINDPELAKDTEAKRMAVNAFIAHAVQAELYCGRNRCSGEEQPSS